MHLISAKLQIITMIFTISIIGCTTNSIHRSSTQQPPSSPRIRHQRSTRSISSTTAPPSTTLTPEELNALAESNANKVNSPEWKCGTPRPRLVYMNEATGRVPFMGPHMSWIVKSTVLYRCENTLGCCPTPRNCAPTQTEEVTITFKAINLHNDQASFEQLQFRNHTRCSCVLGT